MDRRSYRVAVYIEVGGGWWNKPLWSRPTRKIKKNGSWKCRVATGGVDELATTFVAYLIPKDFEPPLRQGESSLPFEIEQAAVARAEVSRSPPP